MNAIVPIHQIQKTAEVMPPVVEKRPQDWELLNSPGHVLGARIKRLGWIGFPLALAAFAWGGFNIYHTATGYHVAVDTPGWVETIFSANPDTAVDLGGGVRVSYRLHWLTDHTPRVRGLDLDTWPQLVHAVRADMGRNGTNAAAWETVAGLEIAPQITRPERVFSEYSERLETGIVAVFEHTPISIMTAAVEGGWGMAVTNGSICNVILGPEVPSCPRIEGSEVIDFVNEMKPAPAGQEAN